MTTHFSQDLIYDLHGLVDVKKSGGNCLRMYRGDLSNAATRLEEIAKDVRFQATVRTIYDEIRRYGCWSLQVLVSSFDAKHLATVNRVILWLVREGLISMILEGDEVLVLMGPPPPEDHPLDLCLYSLEVGATYWIVAPYFEKKDYEDLAKHMAAMILEAEGTPLTGDILKQFEEVYCDDPPTSQDIKQLLRTEGIRIPCRSDAGLEHTTVWTVFCEKREPGILACSEW